MKKLFLITVLLMSITSLVYASEVYTGRDMICHGNSYLSTDCRSAKVLPFVMYDREIALEDAKSEKNIDNSQIINKTYIINEAQGVQGVSDIKVESYIEAVESNDFPDGGFANGYNSDTYYKK